MIKNFKHPLFLLAMAYSIPSLAVYVATRDAQLAEGIGGLCIMLAAFPLWKYAK